MNSARQGIMRKRRLLKSEFRNQQYQPGHRKEDVEKKGRRGQRYTRRTHKTGRETPGS
jgi:hypothetical protein